MLASQGAEQGEKDQKISSGIKNQIPVDSPLIDVMDFTHLENPISPLHGAHTFGFCKDITEESSFTNLLFRGTTPIDFQEVIQFRLRQNTQANYVKSLKIRYAFATGMPAVETEWDTQRALNHLFLKKNDF